MESKAYGYLLGSGGAAGEGGALARFVPDARERGRVLEAVAHECAASAQASPCHQLARQAGTFGAGPRMLAAKSTPNVSLL